MKTILLATSNKDKFKVVKYLLQKAGLEETEYQILSLKDVNYSAPDEKEQGSIDQRARTKAISVVNNIPNREIYDFIIGMDSENARWMPRILGGDPEEKISLLMDYTSHPRSVADPWYTGNFEATYADVTRGCRSLLDKIQSMR